MSMSERSEILLGSNSTDILSCKSVALFGVGGVGSYVLEAIARSGVGNITIVDGDVVCESNLNRQLVALTSTMGKYKSEIAKSRVLDINPKANVISHNWFFNEDNCEQMDFSQYDYVIDAIDDVNAKILIAKKCNESKTELISCMGAGNRLDPSKFVITDVFSTKGDPLARVMRHKLRQIGIEHLKVICSTAPSILNKEPDCKSKPTIGSVPYVPSVAGLICAGYVVQQLLID